MQTLQIIFHAAAIIANAALTFFAVTAWFMLRRQRVTMDMMQKTTAYTAAMTMAAQIKSDINELDRLKATLAHLIENEQFEEAEKVKALVEKAEQQVTKAISRLNDIDGIEIKVERIRI